MKKKKKENESRIVLKLILCLVYLVIMTILFVCSYRIFQEKQSILPWSEVESVDDYTYIVVSQMSEKFAFYSETNVGIHFVIEKEDTGLWHTYLIAINEDDYDEYKDLIDYTYERTNKIPKQKKVYGYPVITSDEIKALAIKNIPNFVPAENEVKITEDNYESYLTNCYLDTTRSKKDNFSTILFISFLLTVIVFVLFIITLFDKGKKVDKNEKKEDEIDRARWMFERNKAKKKTKSETTNK